MESIRQKQPCQYESECKFTRDIQHIQQFYHPCAYGLNCRNKSNELHRQRFTHPCQLGTQCPQNIPGFYIF